MWQNAKIRIIKQVHDVSKTLNIMLLLDCLVCGEGARQFLSRGEYATITAHYI